MTELKDRQTGVRQKRTPARSPGAVPERIAAPSSSSGSREVLSCGDGADEVIPSRRRGRGASPSVRANQSSAQISRPSSARRSGRKQPNPAFAPLPKIDLDEVKEGWTCNPNDYTSGSKVAFRTVAGSRASMHVARYDGVCEDT